MALIFDIETVGEKFDELDEVTKNNLTRWIKREAAGDEEKYNVMLTDIKEGLGFSPLTGQIVAIGIFDTVKNQGVVYYQAPAREEKETREENFTFKPKTEEEMLSAFWQGAINYQEFVSFNGRSFDVPFLVLRSAKYQIKPTLNLMTYRYGHDRIGGIRHIDLLDQFTYQGAVRRKGSLHLFCRMFNIKSPKAAGITGDDIDRLFQEQKYLELAEYNSWDLIATWELYKIWQKYVSI
ncbi:MAG: ribonuclease H-like domain-containing protein [Candidatus Falkowbacteria bacterium]|nr:ribonuclease H-like domain-containing protein [Candidatus Falkowbacteria bacterium]